MAKKEFKLTEIKKGYNIAWTVCSQCLFTGTYGESLSKIKITGTMKVGDTVVKGTFSWQQPGDTILDASTLGHDVG